MRRSAAGSLAARTVLASALSAAMSSSYSSGSRLGAAVAPSEVGLSALGGFPGGHWAGILALGLDVAVDELNHRHRGVVALTETSLHDAGIPAIAGLVARAEDIDQLLDQIRVAQAGDGDAAGVQVALLAERHQLLDDRTQVLGFRQRRRDLLVLDQRLRHIGEHRLTVLGGAVEAAFCVSVVHLALLIMTAAAPRYGRSFLFLPF